MASRDALCPIKSTFQNISSAKTQDILATIIDKTDRVTTAKGSPKNNDWHVINNGAVLFSMQYNLTLFFTHPA